MARAKGLSNLYITARHVLKNALIPVVTYFGPAIAFLITGSFVVESIFSIPGMEECKLYIKALKEILEAAE